MAVSSARPAPDPGVTTIWIADRFRALSAEAGWLARDLDLNFRKRSRT
jgi:hypothetical protein